MYSIDVVFLFKVKFETLICACSFLSRLDVSEEFRILNECFDVFIIPTQVKFNYAINKIQHL